MAQFFIDRPVFATVLSIVIMIVIMIVGGVALVGMPVAQGVVADAGILAVPGEIGRVGRDLVGNHALLHVLRVTQDIRDMPAAEAAGTSEPMAIQLP